MSARERFASELRAWREQAGLTQDEMRQKLNMSLSNYKKIEACDRKAQRDIAQACDKLFGCPGTFERMYEEALAEPYPEWFGQRIIYEDKAAMIHEWEMRCVLGLVQTPAYARAVTRAGKPYESEDEIERRVRNRIERQEIFTREDPPKLWAVQCEGVLRKMVGGPRVMRDQLDHLLSVAESQGVVIQVLPFHATDTPGVDGPGTLFEFTDAPQVCYLEGWGAGRIVKDPKSVAPVATAFSMIKSCALSPTESTQLIARIRSEL